jgi:hypothetical protein
MDSQFYRTWITNRTKSVRGKYKIVSGAIFSHLKYSYIYIVDVFWEAEIEFKN